ASLDLLNEKLRAAGRSPVEMERFRPNIVLSGVEAHDEDRLDLMTIATDDGPVQLRPVKPSPRCPIPNVDPATAEVDTIVTDTLQGYRRNEVLGGAISFGMNVIVVEGEGSTLKVGQSVAADWKFD
ncbi:MAG TPA: MOSC domain-containing protein, partial [Ramlibacter sp.]